MKDQLVDAVQAISALNRSGGAETYAKAGGVQVRSIPNPKHKEPSLDDLRLPMETAKEAKERFQQVSRRNIKVLMAWRPASPNEMGIEARWLRRLQDRGLGYASKASQTKLELLAKFFKLSHYTDLWREDLLDSMGLPGPTPERVTEWKHSPHWKQAEKLLQLLDTGNYGHLSTIIDDLHELEVARYVRSTEKRATKGKAKTVGDFVKKRKKKS